MSQYQLNVLKKKAKRAVSAMAAVLVLSAAFTTVFSLSAGKTLAVVSQCSDGADNDGNGLVDYPQDTGCTSLDDDYEGRTTSGNFVTVTDERDTVQAGGSVIYLVTLKQQRDTNRVVNVTLDLPHQSNVTSASDGGDVALDHVTWTNVSVYKDVTRTLQVQLNVNPSAVVGQYLVARVRVNGSEAIDTTLVKDYVPEQNDQFRVTVSDGRDYILPGAQNTYTVKIRNTSSQVKKTDIRLALPYDSYYVSASDAGIRDSYNVTWKNIELQPNEERSFNATIQIDFRTRNNALLRAKAYAGTVVALDQTVARIGLPYHSISTSITDHRNTAEMNQVLTYTVKVDNTSDVVATDVPVDASLPLYGEFVGATEGGYWDGSNIRWLVLKIAPHATRTLTYSVRVRQDAPLNTLLTASATSDDATSRDTTTVVAQSTETGMAPQKTVIFRKTADRGEAVPGGSIRYTLYVQNTLDHVISDASILDRFDSTYLSLDTYEHSESLASHGDGEMVWTVPVLQPGESWQTSYILAVSANAPSGMELDNVASLRGADLNGMLLTQRVRTNKAGVISDFPTTGASMDAFLALALAGLAVATTGVQKKLAFARLLASL